MGERSLPHSRHGIRSVLQAAVAIIVGVLVVALAFLGVQAQAQDQEDSGAVTQANGVAAFNVHSSAGVQAERAITVILRDNDGPEYEVRLPELLIQMVREANRGTFILMPALGHVVLVPMPDFAVFSRDLPVLSEVNRPDHRALDIMPAGSTPDTMQRVHGLSVKHVTPGTTAEDDARASLRGMQKACETNKYGYQFEQHKESGRGILLTLCARLSADIPGARNPETGGTVDVSLSYVIDDVAFRIYSIHRHPSWDPQQVTAPLSEAMVLEVVRMLDRSIIFEDIDESALRAAFLMAER